METGTLKPASKIALVGFTIAQAKVFRDCGLDVCGHIYTGKARPENEDDLATLSFERFKKFEYPHFHKNQLKDRKPELPDAEALSYFVRCVERWDWSKELVNDWTDYQHLYSIASDFSDTWLNHCQPDVLIFSNVPHQGALISLYYLARKRGIKTILFMQSHVATHSYAVTHWGELGRAPVLPRSDGYEFDITPPSKPPFYMATIRTDIARALYCIGSITRAKLIIGLGLTGFSADRRRQSFNRNLGRLKKEKENLYYFNATSKFFTCKLDELKDKEFIYFPLHLQPEMTTDILGNEFADQALALEVLRERVPAHIPIAVKENPKQRSQMRGPAFFERLKRIPNLIGIDRNTPSFDLIRQSKAVATITGTAGWESVLMGKPVIGFGDTYWSALPGVFHIHDKWTWSEVAAFGFDKEKLKEGADRLGKTMWPGMVDMDYIPEIENFDADMNSAKLAGSISNLLERWQ